MKLPAPARWAIRNVGWLLGVGVGLYFIAVPVWGGMIKYYYVSHELRSHQVLAQKEISALLDRVEQVSARPLFTMTDDQLRSYIYELTNAKQTALSADKELESILNNLHTQIISTTTTLGLASSVINASQILSDDNERASSNMRAFRPYFSAAAQKDSIIADAAVFVLTHNHHQNGFDDPSDNQKFDAIVSLEHQATDVLNKAADVFNNTKDIYVRDR